MTRKTYFRFLTGCVLTPLIIGVPLWWTLTFAVAFAVAAIVIIPLFICRHCPQWANDKWYLECDAHWGLPKLYAPTDMPLSRWQHVCFYAGFAVTFTAPVLLLLLNAEPRLAVCAATNGVLWFLVLQRSVCNTCVNYNCPIKV